MSKLVNCKACGNQISKGAKCPGCGKDNRSFFAKHKILTFILVFIIIGSIGAAMGGNKKEDEKTTTTVTKKNEGTKSDIKTTTTVAKKEENKPVEQPKPAEKQIPSEYKAALKKAEVYSNTMSMSKSGIYKQLTSEYGEKFKADAAQYAVDNLKSNYNENALKKAKTYQQTMNMSKSAIYDQLISEHGEGFTKEEAKYAVDNLPQ